MNHDLGPEDFGELDPELAAVFDDCSFEPGEAFPPRAGSERPPPRPFFYEMRQGNGALRFRLDQATDMGAFRTVKAHPQFLFRPQGLITWGASNETLIHRLFIGGKPVFILTPDGIPARFFESGVSFAEFLKLGELPAHNRPRAVADRFAANPIEREINEWLVLSRRPVTAPHQRLDVSTCEVGDAIELEWSGPLEQAVLWGRYVQ